MEGSQYLQRLIRQAAATPSVLAAAVAGPAEGDRFAELALYLAVDRGLPEGWTAPAGAAAYAGAEQIITEDGLTIRLRVNEPFPPGAQPLFDRRVATAAPEAPVLPDLESAAARFWSDLYGAGAAIGRAQPFTVHGRLERCRAALLDIYRLALRPDGPGAGWEGAEALPGAARVLDPVQEWLVQPLDLRAQWRCAYKLAEAYEKLMLPLAERLGLAYPWTMRNLAFRRLDEIRPDRGGAPNTTVPRLRDTADEPDPAPRRGGPGRFRVRTRRGEE
ncbi:MAG TPA: hypothetical protein VD969_03250 [Symbiobacteriaceae bacterium]|nr:hypothetical protein [Symbiobacteriaceae bacterium]